MDNVKIFPLSKSRPFLERAAAAIASFAHDPDAWDVFHDPLALSLLDRGVADERVGIELEMLRDRAAAIVARRASAPARKAHRRLRLVPPIQGDLFATPDPDFGIGKLEGDIAEGER